MVIELIIGPMFSGKTSLLYRRIQFARSINKKVLVINHANDIRKYKLMTQKNATHIKSTN